MDITLFFLLTLSATLLGASWHAHRIGNERRDVALLAGIGSLLGAGALAAAAI
jgi:uncharacterized membrane protein YadS